MMRHDIPRHLQASVDQILALPVSQPPPPWQLVCEASVGGLRSIGFARNTELLLVTSSQGRGVFDATTGQRVARDSDEDFHEDPFNLEAAGIGPLDGQMIRMTGIHGGGLPASTPDGWRVERLAILWPDESALLITPGSWVFGVSFGKKADLTKVMVDSEIRAWGFSASGQSLVLAESSGLRIYTRRLINSIT